MTREEASTPPCWRPAAATGRTRLLLALRELSPSVFWRRGCGLGHWRGEVLLIDCRRDHIDCRLNIHYSLDLIFRPSFLVTARQSLSQRPTLGEQLVSRFLEGLQMVWVMIISPYRAVQEVLIALRLLPLSPPHRTFGRFRFPPFMLIHTSSGQGTMVDLTVFIAIASLTARETPSSSKG